MQDRLLCFLRIVYFQGHSFYRQTLVLYRVLNSRENESGRCWVKAADVFSKAVKHRSKWPVVRATDAIDFFELKAADVKAAGGERIR